MVEDTREAVEAKLKERRARLHDLETRGVEALSEYDIHIAYGGDAEKALRESIRLVRNHVSFYTKHLAKMPPEQGRLL